MTTLSEIRLAIVYNWRNIRNSIIEKPIHIRATQYSRVLYLSTGIKIPPDSWDERNKRVISHPLSDFLNKQLYDQLNDIESFKIQMMRQGNGSSFPLEQIKDYQNADSHLHPHFNHFCQYELEHSTDAPSTKRSHKSKLNVFFKRFRKEKPVYFYEIKVRLIKQFDRFIREAITCHQNTIWSYHKTLKSYINKAIREDLLKENPYDRFKVEREREENIKREWLTLEEMRRIENLTFDEEERSLYNIKNFILVCLWSGVRFSTAGVLTPADLYHTKEGMVLMKLKIPKTNKRLFMPLYLLGEKNENGLTKPEQLFQDLLDQRNKETNGQEDFNHLPFFGATLHHYNRKLKRLAELAHIQKNMTTHIGRRTFINTMASDFGLPVTLVSKLVQHGDIRTTMKYINQSDKEIIRELKRVDIKL